MVECLVYIGVLFLILGAGYVALYQGIDNSVTLHRNATISRPPSVPENAGELTSVLLLPSSRSNRILKAPFCVFLSLAEIVSYRLPPMPFSGVTSGSWISVVSNVKSIQHGIRPARASDCLAMGPRAGTAPESQHHPNAPALHFHRGAWTTFHKMKLLSPTLQSCQGPPAARRVSRDCRHGARRHPFTLRCRQLADARPSQPRIEIA